MTKKSEKRGMAQTCMMGHLKRWVYLINIHHLVFSRYEYDRVLAIVSGGCMCTRFLPPPRRPARQPPLRTSPRLGRAGPCQGAANPRQTPPKSHLSLTAAGVKSILCCGAGAQAACYAN